MMLNDIVPLIAAVLIGAPVFRYARREFRRKVPLDPPFIQQVFPDKETRGEQERYGRQLIKIFKYACIATDLSLNVGTGSRRFRFIHPSLGVMQINPETGVFRLRIKSMPFSVPWSKLLDGRLRDELHRELHIPIEVVEGDDGHFVLFYTKDPPGQTAAARPLPATVAYTDMFPLPRRGVPLPVGIDAAGRPHYHDLTNSNAPHVLVGGASGSGKSTLINTWLTTLVSEFSPDDIQLLLIDLKKIELAVFRSLPHCWRLATEGEEALTLLDDLLAEVNRRYARVEVALQDNIPDGDEAARILKDLPRLVLVIDELAELTMSQPASLATLIRIAQLGRAAKVNIIAATQRPSVDVCPGTLKTNFEARVALALPTQADSRVILDVKGAEELEKSGQAIYKHGSRLTTVMAPWLAIEERNRRLRAVRDRRPIDPAAAPATRRAALDAMLDLSEQERLILETMLRLWEQTGKRPGIKKVYEALNHSMPRAAVGATLKRHVKQLLNV